MLQFSAKYRAKPKNGFETARTEIFMLIKLILKNIVEDIRNNYDYRVDHTANLPVALPIHPANTPL